MIWAKDYLRMIRKIDRLIENKLAEKEQWKAVAYGSSPGSNTVMIKGVAHEMDRVQSTGNQQKMADAVIKYVDIESEIDEYIDLLVDAKRDVISVLEQLSATEYDLMHKMYVGMVVNERGRSYQKYMTKKEVAAYYDMSESWAKNVHSSALKNVQRIINQREEEQNESWLALTARWRRN